MSELTVAELIASLIEAGSEGKHTFVVDSSGKMLMLTSGNSPQHINLEQLTFWSRNDKTKT